MKEEEIQKKIFDISKLYRVGKYKKALKELTKIEKDVTIKLPLFSQSALYDLIQRCHIAQKSYIDAASTNQKAAELALEAKVYGVATLSFLESAMLNFSLNDIERGIELAEKGFQIFRYIIERAHEMKHPQNRENGVSLGYLMNSTCPSIYRTLPPPGT